MLVLGIDTSTRTGAFCIYDSSFGVIAQIKVEVALNHSDTIMRAVNELFQIGGIDKSKLDLVAVGLGPGSFTGIRVGMGVAKGLAYSMNKAIRGVNTLDVMAEKGSMFIGKVIPMIDARHGRVFYSEYISDGKMVSRVSDYSDDEIEEIAEKSKNEKILFLGDGAYKYKEKIENTFKSDKLHFNKMSQNSIDPGLLCELALKQGDDNIYKVEPFYLVKSQAERIKKVIV